LKGFLTLFARFGKYRDMIRPAANGMPRTIKIVIKTSTGLKLTSCKIFAVSGLRFPQNARLSGVMNIAAAVDIAVIVMEIAVFPFARYVMILERLPPGHAATSIIPKAIEGCGFMIMVKRK